MNLLEANKSKDIVEIAEINDMLNVDLTDDEISCIIENVCYAAVYVNEDADSQTIISGGGIIGNIGEETPIQPLWKQNDFHRDVTKSVATKYFSDSIATKIGNYDKDVDTKYSAVTAYIFETPAIYIHFNEYATGSDDSRDYIAAMWFVSARLAWNNGNKESAYMYLGYGLHPIQDKEAHGQIGRGKARPQHIVSYTNGDNIIHADDTTGWEWTNSSRNALKSVSGSKVRYNAAVNETNRLLSEFSQAFK